MLESRQGLSPQQLQQWQESSSTWVKLENRLLAAFVWLCNECLFKGSLKNMTLKSFKHATFFFSCFPNLSTFLSVLFLAADIHSCIHRKHCAGLGFHQKPATSPVCQKSIWSGQTRWNVTNNYVIRSCECGDDAITHIFGVWLMTRWMNGLLIVNHA